MATGLSSSGITYVKTYFQSFFISRDVVAAMMPLKEKEKFILKWTFRHVQCTSQKLKIENNKLTAI